MSGKAARCRAVQVAGYTAFLALLVAGAVLFYFGGFRELLSDQSSSFAVELALTQSRAHREASLVVLGNSTAAEDFHVNRFNARSPGQAAVDLGVPSGHLYLFDRILSAGMREGLRPRVVVLMLTPEVLSLRPDFDYLLNDLVLLKTVLDSGDLLRLRAHSRSLRAYVNYGSYVVARPVLFRADLRDFFSHPRERIENAEAVRKWLASFGPATPAPQSSNEFSVCQVRSLPDLPQAIAALRKQGRTALAADYQRVLASYAPRAHQPLRVDAFETLRLRRLLARFRSLGLAVYVIPAPYYDPDDDQYPLAYRRDEERALHQVVRAVPGVTLLPAFPADCSLFFDTVHLNRAGADQFTDYLYHRVL